MNRTTRTLSAVTLLALLLAACAGTPAVQSPTAAPAPAVTSAPVATQAPAAAAVGAIQVTDASGRTFSLPQIPERVVCLYNSCFGQMATLDVLPVAILVNDEMPPDPIYFGGAAQSLPRVKSSDAGIDAESVASFKPDLIVAWGQEELQALEGIAPVYLQEGTLDSIEGVKEELWRLALIFGKQEQAEAAITRFDERLAAYAARASKDVVVLKLGATGDDSFAIATVNDPICQILNQLARCNNPDPTGATDTWSYAASLEGVLAIDPDVIILNNWWGDGELSDAQLLQKLDANPLWRELKAVKNQRVIAPIDGYSNPVASSLLGAQKFLDVYMPLIYPEVFPQALTDAEVQAIVQGEGASEPQPATGFPQTITDGSGATLNFDEPPTRIACLYTRCIELLAALRYDQIAVPAWAAELVADPRYFPQPNAITLLPETSDDVGVDLEQLAAFKPDLVLGWAELRPAVEGFAPVHAVVDEMNSYQKSFEEIRTFAALLGREAEAEEAITRFDERLAAYVARAPKDRSVMYIWPPDGAAVSYRDGGSGTCQLLKQIADCDWPDPANEGSWSVDTTVEGLLQLNPDALIVDNGDGTWPDSAAVRAALVAQNPLWGELAAVQNQRVFLMDSFVSASARDGMGTVGAALLLDTYAPLLYPEVFPAPLTDAEVQEILAP
jgi:iron complex transport system substrate-binding protein